MKAGGQDDGGGGGGGCRAFVVCLFVFLFLQTPQNSCIECTHNEGVFPTHDDHSPVDDREQRHHNVLDVLEGFSL